MKTASSRAVCSRGRSTDPLNTNNDRKDRTVKNKEELPMNSDRGAWQRPLDFAREEEWARRAKLFRTEPTDPALTDQPALDVSPEDALMELIVIADNLQRAWRQVKGNRGAPGPDGMTIAEFEAWAHENWATVRQQLVEGTYQPQPVRRKTIPKPGGKGDRLLGIPNVLDRLIQQAIVQVLTPIFDPGFLGIELRLSPQSIKKTTPNPLDALTQMSHVHPFVLRRGAI